MSGSATSLKTLLLWTLCFPITVTNGWLSAAFGAGTEDVKPVQTIVELDIIEALNISDDMRGVTVVQGSTSNTKAWRFHTSFDHVQLPEIVTKHFLSKLTKQMSVEFIYRQHHQTVATLFSVNSPGKMSPWLRVTSNTKLGKLYIFYRINEDDRLHEKVFGLRGTENWTRIGITINGTELHFLHDCRPPDKQKLAGHAVLKFPPDSLIYFRQEPGFKKKLLGSVEVAKITSSAQYRPSWQCSASIRSQSLV